MNRRDLLKALSILGGSINAPKFLAGGRIVMPAALTGYSATKVREARAAVLDQIEFSKPTVVPQVINLFLYGGPSELAGNLSNIDDISANSQNSYGIQRPNLLSNSNGDPGAGVTASKFWAAAGGTTMEDMIAANQMTIYRTLYREPANDSKAHRLSIFSNLNGNPDNIDDNPGMGAILAAIFEANRVSIFGDRAVTLPLVTFEGDSQVFNKADLVLRTEFRAKSFNSNLQNPYERGPVPSQDSLLDKLANDRVSRYGSRFQGFTEALEQRASLAEFLSGLTVDAIDADLAALGVTYPANNTFATRLKAAVGLCLRNPDTLFVSLGSGGLGGWDDHDNAIGGYETRMTRLMEALQAAVNHIDAARASANPELRGAAGQEGKRNIIINCFGDFGRNVNLNNSMGWDHGNNQNLYTVGGQDIPGRGMGRIVGETQRIGNSGVNRQFTAPTSNSYKAEPFAVAASIYKYFGLTETSIKKLTGGTAPLDETA